MSLTSARLLASSWSGATFGSLAATGRVAAMSPLITPVGFPAASRMIDPLTKSVGSGASRSIPNAFSARLFRKTW